MTIRSISFAVVGADHPNKNGGNRRSEIAFCNPGEPIKLCPEPKNEFDEHAIAVFTARGFQIGYLKSERAVFVGGLIRDGRTLTAIFQDIAPWGAIIRVGVDEVPTLPGSIEQSPDPYEQSDAGAGFWPDFIPPDD